MDAGRLIIDEPARGSWNMAVDEALLHSAGNDNSCCLRFYQWNEPTLSLGYFQRFADRELHRPSLECAVVRRSTGGGAIVHDRELTYSFTTSIRNRTSGNVAALYDAFHETLIETLAQWDVKASLFNTSKPTPRDAGPFLCFQRRSTGDVVIGDNKIAGSAQRRHKNAVLQHGSVLLKCSPCAPELPGIEDMGHVQIDTESLITRWTNRLAGRLGLDLKTDSLSRRESSAAATYEGDKFTGQSWLLRR